jgi:hypothetical protein
MKKRLIPVRNAVLPQLVALAASGPAPVSVAETEVVSSTVSPSNRAGAHAHQSELACLEPRHDHLFQGKRGDLADALSQL